MDILQRSIIHACFYADHVATEIVFPRLHETHEPGFIRESGLAFAGIARPELFEARSRHWAPMFFTSNDLKITIFIESRTSGFIANEGKCGRRYLITTEKDWVGSPFRYDLPEIAYWY